MQIKNRQQFLTILTLTAVGLLALDRIVRPPLQKMWSDRSAQIATLQRKVKEGKYLLSHKESLRSRWDEIQKSTLPNDPTAAEHELNNSLSQWLNFSDVSLSGIAPTWKPGDAAYKTLEYRVDASGNMDQLSRFLYSLETDNKALRVQSIELTAKDATGTSLALGVQVSGLVLTTPEVKK